MNNLWYIFTVAVMLSTAVLFIQRRRETKGLKSLNNNLLGMSLITYLLSAVILSIDTFVRLATSVIADLAGVYPKPGDISRGIGSLVIITVTLVILIRNYPNRLSK